MRNIRFVFAFMIGLIFFIFLVHPASARTFSLSPINPALTKIIVSDNENFTEEDFASETVSGLNQEGIQKIVWQIPKTEPVYIRLIYQSGVVEDWIAENIEDGSLIKINNIEIEVVFGKRIDYYSLVRYSDGSETAFSNGEVEVGNLSPGGNKFLVVRHFRDGSTEASEVLTILYNKSTAEETQPVVQEPDPDQLETIGTYQTCLYVQNCLNEDTQTCTGILEDNVCVYDSSGRVASNCSQCSRDQSTESNFLPQDEETSADNGDGTYTVFKDSKPVAQYRFYDQRQVVAKCRDTATDLNTLVFVNNGVEKIDVDCRDLGQMCREFVNEADQAGARCE